MKNYRRKKKELVSNTVYFDLFDSSVEDFEELLKKMLNILEPEIEKLKLNKGNIKDTIFQGKLEKTEKIKKEVNESITKYKVLSFLSSYIPILDIYLDYKVREYMFDKIAE